MDRRAAEAGATVVVGGGLIGRVAKLGESIVYCRGRQRCRDPSTQRLASPSQRLKRSIGRFNRLRRWPVSVACQRSRREPLSCEVRDPAGRADRRDDLTLPNFFGESAGRAGQQRQGDAQGRQRAVCRARATRSSASAASRPTSCSSTAPRCARFQSTDTQHQGQGRDRQGAQPDAADRSYIVALNLVAAVAALASPLHAPPMYLGLDLQAAAHFPMQVDMKAGADQAPGTDRRASARCCATRTRPPASRDGGNNVTSASATRETLAGARATCWSEQLPDLTWTDAPDGAEFKPPACSSPRRCARRRRRRSRQNITTLHNRVNELGVAEPVIQQRWTVSSCNCPAQDTAKAKDIIGPHRHAGGAHGRTAPKPRRQRPAAGRCLSAPSATSSAAARR